MNNLKLLKINSKLVENEIEGIKFLITNILSMYYDSHEIESTFS